MPEIILEHDERSPWVWDRAAVERAVEELGVTESVTLRQVYGLTPRTNALGRTSVQPGHQEIEVESLLDPGEAASGVTWHELGHAADNIRHDRSGTFSELFAASYLGKALGIEESTPHEREARRVSRAHRGESLTLTVRNVPAYKPEFPHWREVPGEGE